MNRLNNMKTILTIEATIHNSVSMPWEMGEQDENGSYSEMKRGVIKPFSNASELESLRDEADEVYEVDSLAARTNSRRVK